MSQQINLFNPIFLKQKKILSAVNMLEALGLLFIGVIVFYGIASFNNTELARQADETARHYRRSKLQLAELSARYAPIKIDVALEAEVKNQQAQVASRQALLDSLGVGALTNDTSYAEYMRALARQSLGGLWLTGFKVFNGGKDMEIIGRALQPELVPSYIRRLRQERTMQGRAFDSLAMEQRQGQLPADASRPGSAPERYSYTEFRLGSTHAELPSAGLAVSSERAQPAPSAGSLQEKSAPASQEGALHKAPPAQDRDAGPR